MGVRYLVEFNWRDRLGIRDWHTMETRTPTDLGDVVEVISEYFKFSDHGDPVRVTRIDGTGATDATAEALQACAIKSCDGLSCPSWCAEHLPPYAA